MAARPRTILVTGATGGIGLAVSRRLARGGDALVLAARDAGAPRSLAAELADGTSGVSWLSVDMTRDDSIRAFADELATRRMTGVNLLHDGGFTRAY